MVQKWATHLQEINSSNKESESEPPSESSSRAGTPMLVKDSKTLDQSQPMTPTSSESLEAIPHKKRRLLQRSLEEVSSSDGELSDCSKISGTVMSITEEKTGSSKSDMAESEGKDSQVTGSMDDDQVTRTRDDDQVMETENTGQ